LHHAVRDGAVACNEAVGNARPTVIAEARAAACAGGMGLEAMWAVTTSAPGGAEGMKASTPKTASGVKATAAVSKASTMEATTPMKTATMKAATASMEATAAAMEATAAAMKAATAAVKATAATTTAMARLCCACERQPHNRAREDSGER